MRSCSLRCSPDDSDAAHLWPVGSEGHRVNGRALIENFHATRTTNRTIVEVFKLRGRRGLLDAQGSVSILSSVLFNDRI